MRDTRLIFVDGMSGSGKSVTSHWLARQLGLNGRPVRWLHEEEEGHPLAWTQPEDLPADATETEKKERYLRDYPAQWARFADLLDASTETVIVDGYLFMCTLMPLVRLGFPKSRIESFIAALLAPLERHEPVLIGFWQADIPAAFRLNWQRRGADWENWYKGRLEGSDYAKSRGLSGEEAAYSIGSGFTETWLGIAERLALPKLLIENSGQDWPAYRRQVLEFIGIEEKPEALASPEDEIHCGTYAGLADGESVEYRVHRAEGRLVLDAFWPGLLLLPRGSGRYLIEGFPFDLRFLPAETGQPARLEFRSSVTRESPDFILSKNDSRLPPAPGLAKTR